MESLRIIINNLAENESAAKRFCAESMKSGACDGVNCAECFARDKGALNRAKNYANNTWGK